MRSDGLKYILVYCFVTALLLKTSGVASVLLNSIKTEYNSGEQDSAEKEKIETEYFESNLFGHLVLKAPVQLKEKTPVTQNSFFPAYFPDVLTPPPSLKA